MTRAGADTAIRELAVAARDCRNCDLWERATQTVFGEGPSPARLMLVGEQPGDQEDKNGHPFVGPAGRVLDDALVAAGIDRRDVYLTNAVKHFRWEERGKRRLHKRPTTQHVRACQAWLVAEVAAVRPTVIVAMGAVAVRSVLGTTEAIHSLRGRWIDHEPRPVVVTIHPSAVLRAPDPESRRADLAGFVDDLRLASAA